MEKSYFTKKELQLLFDIISSEAGDYLDGAIDKHNLKSCIRKFEEQSSRKMINAFEKHENTLDLLRIVQDDKKELMAELKLAYKEIDRLRGNIN